MERRDALLGSRRLAVPAAYSSSRLCLSRTDSIRNDVDSAALVQSFQIELSSIVERQPRPGDEVPRRRGHDYLTRASECRHARRDMDGDPARARTSRALHLAGVHTGTHFQSEGRHSVHDR
jgi:hypothetical protein